MTPEVLNTLLTIGGPVGAIFMLGWWLSGRFRKHEMSQRDRLDELKEAYNDQLDMHEQKDQERHEENLERFRTISVSLAKLGASNGSR